MILFQLHLKIKLMKEFREGRMHVRVDVNAAVYEHACMAGSLCHPPETMTTLLISYTPEYKIKGVKT